MSNELIPITDVQAELGKQALTTVENAGGWVAGILQDVPKDLIGALGGDWLHNKKAQGLADLAAKTSAHRARRGGPSVMSFRGRCDDA